MEVWLFRVQGAVFFPFFLFFRPSGFLFSVSMIKPILHNQGSLLDCDISLLNVGRKNVPEPSSSKSLRGYIFLDGSRVS